MSNARMQQIGSLVLLALAGWWVWSCIRSGQPAMAAWALLALVPHAPVMAIEVAWAAAVARREAVRRPLGQVEVLAQPYPSVMTWIGAWAQEMVASVRTFGWQQPWAHGRYPDHLPADARGRRGVLLVHGFVCNRGFWNLWMPRLRRAGVPHAAVSVGPPFADIALQARGLQRAWEQLVETTGQAPVLVGHSMGGLLIRSWLTTLPAEVAAEQEVITIGSPHHGTALAQFAQSEAAQQMRLLSDFLTALAGREHQAWRAGWTCYWSVCDNIVFPANTATLPGARNVCIAGRSHVGLAEAPEIFQDVLRRTVGHAHRSG